jgi:hypothetical protein
VRDEITNRIRMVGGLGFPASYCTCPMRACSGRSIVLLCTAFFRLERSSGLQQLMKRWVRFCNESQTDGASRPCASLGAILPPRVRVRVNLYIVIIDKVKYQLSRAWQPNHRPDVKPVSRTLMATVSSKRQVDTKTNHGNVALQVRPTGRLSDSHLVGLIL